MTFFKPSIYSQLYVKHSRRARFTPRVGRRWRPRLIAWAGPTAFMRDRFYELDSWYKARIQKPELLPQMHIIDPDQFVETYEQKFQRKIERKIDIGFASRKEVASATSSEDRNRLEQLAIRNQLFIDLERVDSDTQLKLCEHFNVFEDLFLPGVYFRNTQHFAVAFDGQQVHFGTQLKPAQARTPPNVTIGSTGSETHAYNTLLMLNLEGPGQQMDEQAAGASGEGHSLDEQDQLLAHLERRQIVHWAVANIPNGEGVAAGEELFAYLQPVPFYGTGYHRYAFVLFRHRERIDFDAYALKSRNSLAARTFNMNAFYKQFEQQMGPSAVRFCQAKWDAGCDGALERQLGEKAPRYWYEWNERMRPEQKEFPLKPVPFNHYMDMFRNPETVRKEVRRERLERLVKLAPGEQLRPEKYADIDYMENWLRMPRHQHQRLVAQNVGAGVWTSLYEEYENPAEQHEMDKYALDKEGRDLEQKAQGGGV